MSDKKRKILLIVLSSLLVIVIGIIAYMLINNHMVESQYTASISQADRYLQDKNYEDALVAYKQALELDPDSEEPYLGLANTYVAMGDTSKAVSILNQGLERIGSSKIKNLLNQLGNLNANAKDLSTKDSDELTFNANFEQKIVNYTYEDFKEEFGSVESATMDSEGYLEVVHKDLKAVCYYKNTSDNQKIVNTSKKLPYKSAMPERIQLKSLQLLFNNWEGYVSLDNLELLVGKQLTPKKEDGKYVVEFEVGDYTMKMETDKDGKITSDNAWNELTLENANQEESGKSNVEGVITNEETKELVKNATLTFTPQDQEATEETTTTDSNGAFQIELTPGKYVIIIKADDFEDKEIEFEVQEGENYSGEEFEITPGIAEGTVKIVTQWENKSVDIHLHLDGFTPHLGHIRVCNTSSIYDGGMTEWERSETSEYVTETVTIKNTWNWGWIFKIENKGQGGIKAIDGATVKVYIPGKPVTTITLDCSNFPDIDNGWYVCESGVDGFDESEDGVDEIIVLNYSWYNDGTFDAY